jgi:hypothetical protein
MASRIATYGRKARQPEHRSFFRESLAARARPVADGQDRVHEFLIDQANLLGFFGAFSDRDDCGLRDAEVGCEEIVVGLLQPHAPAELRILKLVLRILQSDRVKPERLLLLARRERALATLDWFLHIIPDPEKNPAIERLQGQLNQRPPRAPRWPEVRYDARRLLRKWRSA